MHSTRFIASAATLCTAALLISDAARAQMPGMCWDTNFGTNLNLSDDMLASNLALPFAFPLPGGTGTTQAIDVSSNGLIWLVSSPSSLTACCSASPTNFVTNPVSIAACWMDLNPGMSGAVWFDSSPARAMITWDMVPEYSNQGANSVQVQLYPDGSFSIAILGLTIPGTHNLLVGVTSGSGAADPGEIDYTTTLPHVSTGSTVYEYFQYQTETRDLVGRTLYFLPIGATYFVVEAAACRHAGFTTFGRGCPLPPVFYELFDAANQTDLAGQSYQLRPNGQGGFLVLPCATNCFDRSFTNNLGLSDDGVTTLPLGFAFPVPGSSVGSTTTIDVSSNGFISFSPGVITGGNFIESVADLLAGPERLAVYWDDFNPTAGGAVYGDAHPGRYVVTWDQVPEYGNTNANTFQAQLFPNGDIILSYDTNLASLDGLVGYSPGNGTADPLSIDLTASVPFSTGLGGLPIEYRLGSAQLPQPGTTISLEVANLPASTAAAFVNFGLNRLNIDLARIGMASCFLYSDVLATAPMSLSGVGVASVSLTIPNNTSLIGISLPSQALAVAPNTTTLGVITSNGGSIDIGI